MTTPLQQLADDPSMLLVAVALVSGLLLANALLPPKRGS